MKILSSFKVGSLEVSPNLILAPMSGITNSAFRRLIRELNPQTVGLVVTEFISIEGLTRANRQSLKMMAFRPEEKPISIQIFGWDIDRMVAAAELVEQAGADVLDINCGCPVPKVVKRGGGCELMRQPKHLEKMLKAITKFLKIPLTLKIRSGWDLNSKNALEISRIAEQSGAQMVTIHGRTQAEGYQGGVDWQLIETVKNNVSIPIVGSGDIVDGSSAVKGLNYGLAGLMVGRRALSNPLIFTEIAAYCNNENFVPLSQHQTLSIIKRYKELLHESLPEKAVLGRLKQLGSQITRGLNDGAEKRRMLCTTKSETEFDVVLNQWENSIS